MSMYQKNIDFTQNESMLDSQISTSPIVFTNSILDIAFFFKQSDGC